MADTMYGVNHPLAVKVWRKKLMQEVLKETWASRFMGEDSNSLIQVFDDLEKSAGDRITVGLRMQLGGAGIQGDDTLEGNEEALVTYSDNVFINQLRHAVRSNGKMSEQRVPFSVREEAMQGLKDWWAGRIDLSFMNHICGNSGQADTRFTGNNAVTAPSANRRLFADDNTSETTLTTGTSDNFSLRILDTAVAMAKTASPLIRPLKIKGGDYFVAFLDPWQVQDLRGQTNSGQWADIQKAAISGGQLTENPIFTGALGMYNGVVLHESTRLYTFNTDGGTRCARAVFCGAQSAAIAYGRGEEGKSGDRFEWVEETFDFKNKLGVSAGMIFGLKKLTFNSEDFGTITISTNAIQS